MRAWRTVTSNQSAGHGFIVLVAVALPVFGGLYYALLDFLLFG
jgi:hypothetical protein